MIQCRQRRKQRRRRTAEPVFILKPALKNYGLDYLHIALIALVVILIALAFALAYFKPGVVIKSCDYGAVNGTCTQPVHNSTQALEAAERVMASYAMINTSFSLLPYYALVNDSKVSYLPDAERIGSSMVPYIESRSSATQSSISPCCFTIPTCRLRPVLTGDKARKVHQQHRSCAGHGQPVRKRAVHNSQSRCRSTCDRSLRRRRDTSLYTALNASKRFGSEINMSYYFIFTGSAYQLLRRLSAPGPRNFSEVPLVRVQAEQFQQFPIQP